VAWSNARDDRRIHEDEDLQARQWSRRKADGEHLRTEARI
jgi:hypothetical protein